MAISKFEYLSDKAQYMNECNQERRCDKALIGSGSLGIGNQMFRIKVAVSQRN